MDGLGWLIAAGLWLALAGALLELWRQQSDARWLAGLVEEHRSGSEQSRQRARELAQQMADRREQAIAACMYRSAN